MQKKKKKGEEEKKKKKGAKEPEQTGKKREKKMYDLPGQKRDPPEEVRCQNFYFYPIYVIFGVFCSTLQCHLFICRETL